MRALAGLLVGLPWFVAALDDGSTVEIPCRARAWVRAPDLQPGRVLEGDVKVKLDGTCDDVSSYSIGLRFAERSWVKTRREGVTLPERPTANEPLPSLSNDSVFEPGMSDFGFWSSEPGVEKSSWEKYQEDMKDPALWLVREEERIGFETTHVLRSGERLGHQLIESFALLVPSTNYPPAFDMFMGVDFGNTADSAASEHAYVYFVEVAFANGTRREIPAGYTSYDIAMPRHQSAPETVKVPADRLQRCEGKVNCPKAKDSEDSTPRDEFTLEVTFLNGRHITQGSAYNVTIQSHQLGPGLQRPLGLQSLNTHIQQKRKWAAKHAVDNDTAQTLLESGSMQIPQLRPVVDDEIAIHRRLLAWMNRLESPQFSQNSIVENGTAFSTETLTVPFTVPQDCYPAFDMYYQTSEVSLEIVLEVRNISNANTAALKDDEEHEWTPRKEETETLKANIPVFVHPQPQEDGFVHREPTHYLSPEARTPVFVDPSSVTELRLKTVEDLDNLAPLAVAKIIAPADGDIVKHRYYGKDGGSKSFIPFLPPTPPGPYYVGNTWLRKVLGRSGSRDTAVRADTLAV